MVKRLTYFLLRPWFLAMILSIIVILLLPDMFDKFRIEIVETNRYDPLSELIFQRHVDLDHDGNTELLSSFYSTDSMSAVQVFLPDGGLVDQWNFRGKLINKRSCITGNADHDPYAEIYLFTKDADTVLIHGIELFDSISPISFESRKLCILHPRSKRGHLSLMEAKIENVDADVLGELIISLTSGGKFPNNLFLYDIARDTVIVSETFGTVFTGIEIADLNQDKISEIYGNTNAGGNTVDSSGIKYSDYSAWIMSMDSNLHLRFNPIEFPGFHSKVTVSPVVINQEQLLVAFYNHTGPDENYPELVIVDSAGKIRTSFRFPLSSKIPRQLILKEDQQGTNINIIDILGNVIQFNDQLQLIDTVSLGINHIGHVFKNNLDDHPAFEHIFQLDDKEIIVTSNTFEHPIKIRLPSGKAVDALSIIQKVNSPPLVFHSGKERYAIFKYQKNPWYYAKYPVYAGIFLGLWLFILFIRKIQQIQLQRQELVKRQIMDLQLKAIKNQMDPHFTFNVFNTIAAMIQQENKAIYQPFMKFTNLIRNTLESTDKITRKLSEEISFLKNYLDLELMRNPNMFDYSIDVPDEIDLSMKVPKMLLQIYVENAIKHGLRHKKEKGFLEIGITKIENHLKIEVTDNGIGREKAKMISTGGTGFGLQIMADYFKLFNEYNQSKIKQEIIDLFDDDNYPAGTKVRILIPLNFSYKFSSHGI